MYIYIFCFICFEVFWQSMTWFWWQVHAPSTMDVLLMSVTFGAFWTSKVSSVSSVRRSVRLPLRGALLARFWILWRIWEIGRFWKTSDEFEESERSEDFHRFLRNLWKIGRRPNTSRRLVIGRLPKTSEDFERRWNISENVVRRWETLEDVGRLWKTSDNWKTLDVFSHARLARKVSGYTVPRINVTHAAVGNAWWGHRLWMRNEECLSSDDDSCERLANVTGTWYAPWDTIKEQLDMLIGI